MPYSRSAPFARSTVPCFFALSRRPGRTIREKLADHPYLLAVERRWTANSSENRLVKALCTRIAHLLRARLPHQAPSDGTRIDGFRSVIEGWLQSPAANEIGRWENLPPNNILLQHRDYRRLWDAWLWSETLDEDLQRDQDESLRQWATMVFWSLVSHLAEIDDVRLLEQPCHPDYESFSIFPAWRASEQGVAIHGVIASDERRRGARHETSRMPVGIRISLTPEPPIEIAIDLAQEAGIKLRFGRDGPDTYVPNRYQRFSSR